MADRRKRVKRGLEAVLRSTTEPEPAVEPDQVPQEEDAETVRSPGSYRRATTPRPPKRHTSVYMYPAEFELLDDLLYAVRKNHGMRLPKSDFWRGLLYLAGRMLDDPDRADELLEECARAAER